ncbi:MAG: hypothetical protein IT220_03335 [Flavobacteriaceae bacterium]|nr:hypothetical protein [Flavobacteriaceae bacterium]
MKKLFILLFSTCVGMFSQENAKKISFSYAYGIEYDYLLGKPSAEATGENALFFYGDKLGSFANVNVDLLLSKDRHLGFGFSKSVHKAVLNQEQNLYFDDMLLVLKEFQNYNTTDRYDFHFGKSFNNLDLTIGTFYFINKSNSFEGEFDEESEEIRYVIQTNIDARADNIGLFTSLTFNFPVSETLEFGVNGKMYAIIGQVGVFSISPNAVFKF